MVNVELRFGLFEEQKDLIFMSVDFHVVPQYLYYLLL